MNIEMDDRTRLDTESEIDLRQLWQALFSRKWMIIAFVVIAAIAAYIASDMMTPIYEASTTVLVRESAPVGLQGILPESMGGSGKSDVQRAVKIFKSRTIALKTAEALGYGWDDYSPGLEAFRRNISIHSSSGSDLLKISVEHEDPVEAHNIANMLVQVFIDLTQSINSEDVRRARDFVGDQLQKFEANLSEAEQALVDYKEKYSIIDSGDIPGNSVIPEALYDSLVRLESLKAEAWVNKEAAEKRLAAIQGDLLADKKTITSRTAIANNPIVNGIRSRLVTLEAELAAAGEQYTERHPTIVALKAQINELHNELDKEIQRLETTDADLDFSGEVISIQAEIVAQMARIEALDQLIENREKLFADLPERELTLTRLARDASVTENIYTMLLTRYEEMRISEAMETANVSVLDTAIVPSSPIKPRKKLNVAIAGFLGLFIAVGIALLLEFLDTTFHDAEEIEAFLDVPVLARIPEFDTRGKKQRDAS